MQPASPHRWPVAPPVTMFLSSQSRIVGDAHRSDVRSDAVTRTQFARRRHAIARRTQLQHS
jgi:hypothetical protein